MEKHVVLVFDASQRSALAATRSLGKRKDTVVITCDAKPMALAGKSKYSSAYLQHPDPKTRTAEFVEWTQKVIEENSITMLFPVTEISSRTLLKNKEKLHCVLPFASYDTVLAVSQKSDLMRLADRLGVPIPDTKYFPNAARLDVDKLEYPCVLKPSLSRVLVDEMWIETQVFIVKSATHLASILSENRYLNSEPFMIQAFIDGHGKGIFTYYQQGKPKAFFAHKRLREKPPSGGVSVLSRSYPVDPQMKQYAETLLNAVSWHGAAMVEFRVSHDGTPYLMEINARLWGSLQLAIDAGVDFPTLMLEGEQDSELSAVEHFNENTQLRWLLGDVDNLYLTFKDPSVSVVNKLKHLFRFTLPNFSNRRHEVNRLDDLAPFWFELKVYLGLS